MNRRKEQLVIIGGGPAGLAAAIAAFDAGCRNLVIVERDKELGGILNQCIHNGFGLHTFREELTGPEYANRYINQAKARNLPYLLNTMVIGVHMGNNQKKVITAMNREQGLFEMEADSVILAMGCRERARGALNIPGYRPAGIYSAGTAQRYVNMEGRMPGREVVILGSGDIGLIMARRMTLEGAVVKVVAELMPYSGGLKRNIVQCLDDFGIPLRLSTTVVNIHGKERVEGVTLSRVDEHGSPIEGTQEYIPCDTLLLSCGLIPENELSLGLGVELSQVTNGPVVNESLETNIPGVFACGNVLHVHDLVDYVSGEAAQAGKYAAAYVKENGGKEQSTSCQSGQIDKTQANPQEEAQATQTGRIPILPQGGVRYTVPTVIRPDYMEEKQVIRFRVGNVYQDSCLAVYFNEKCVMRLPKKVMAPGEMEQIILKKEEVEKLPGHSSIILCVEPGGTASHMKSKKGGSL